MPTSRARMALAAARRRPTCDYPVAGAGTVSAASSIPCAGRSAGLRSMGSQDIVILGHSQMILSVGGAGLRPGPQPGLDSARKVEPPKRPTGCHDPPAPFACLLPATSAACRSRSRTWPSDTGTCLSRRARTTPRTGQSQPSPLPLKMTLSGFTLPEPSASWIVAKTLCAPAKQRQRFAHDPEPPSSWTMTSSARQPRVRCWTGMAGWPRLLQP